VQGHYTISATGVHFFCTRTVKPGEALARGQRYGFIRFGSRVDVYLPLSATPKVAVGDKVYATSTVIAEL